MARYENFIIENKVNEYLTTKLNMSQFLTVDTSLEGEPGMTKHIHRYTKSGTAETVDEGDGNTSALSIDYADEDYEVTTTQAKFSYTDEAEMEDPYYVDKGIEAIAESILNEYNATAVDEWEKCTNIIYTGDTSVDFNDFVDAIAELDLEDSEENGFYGLVSPSMKAILRKALKSDLQYVEAFVRAGYIGSVCGIPIYTSKAISDGEIVITHPEAVTCFMKKNVEVEQERDADTRTNDVFGRNVKVIALTNEGKCVLIKTGSAPTPDPDDNDGDA